MARPLTKRDKEGELYTRPLEVETAIDSAIHQDVATLLRRAPCSKLDSPEFMPMECLVHLIREAGDAVMKRQ